MDITTVCTLSHIPLPHQHVYWHSVHTKLTQDLSNTCILLSVIHIKLERLIDYNTLYSLEFVMLMFFINSYLI